MEIETSSLSNGLKIIHQEIKSSEVFHCGLFVNVGSRDETPDERGVAHFLEHALFKGTKRRKAFHILNRLDVVGGELNAYTTKEETVLYASVLNPHMDRALEIIADISFESLFPEHELVKEKAVVIDEILSYQDAPSELIFEDFDEYLFKGHSLGNDILGTEKDVNNIDRAKLQGFVKKHYVPNNMVVSTVGNFTLAQVERKIAKYFERFEFSKVPKTRKIVPVSGQFFNEIKKETHQCHVILGSEVCSYTHSDKTALVLLNNYLGGPALNSKLNMEIREKKGYVYGIDSSIQSYSDVGQFSIYFGVDTKNLNKTKKLVYKELHNLSNNKLSDLKLHQAKEQLKGFIAIGMESKVGLMLGLGKAYLLSDKVDTVQDILTKIDSVTSNDLIEVANKYIHPNSMSELCYLSK
ncbi:MAG: putative Zn-dependent peptidase [Saprospiraceae bacterium]|jgi:predicted Zn-dependent peptidase